MTSSGDLQQSYSEGLLVQHPRMPDWGPGKVLAVEGTKLTVYFRDLPGKHPEDAVKKMDVGRVPLEFAEVQSDPFLDNLPSFRDGKFDKPPRTRLTLKEGIALFHHRYPLYFDDPQYIGDLKTGERAYKWAAHDLFLYTLGDGQAEELLASGQIAELTRRALAVEGRLNIVSVYEKAAFRDGLKDQDAALAYFASLFDLLGTGEIDSTIFERYIASIDRLPAKEGKQPPAKWTVATILPFAAQPNRFMFLKPEVTQECAARLMFDLNYRPQLNWLTYSKLLAMSDLLLAELRPLGARDFIDVQSFIWLIGAGLKGE